MEPTQAVDWITQAARGIAVLHASGATHQNINLENLFLCEDGTIKVLGYARYYALQRIGKKEQQESSFYVAPEVLKGREAGPAADVYALGVTFYEMLWGDPPGTSPMASERRPSSQHHRWQTLRKDHPPLYRLLMSMLAHSPEDRPNAKTVMEELEGMAAQLPGPRIGEWARQLPVVEMEQGWIGITPPPGLLDL